MIHFEKLPRKKKNFSLNSYHGGILHLKRSKSFTLTALTGLTKNDITVTEQRVHHLAYG
jgi:hypothetical protein